MTVTYKVVIGIAILLVIVASLATLFFSNTGETSCATILPQPKIVAFGDSLIEGYGATEEGGFVSILSKQTGISITNYGKSGDTTAQAKSRVAEVLAEHPDIVIVLLGGNDALQHVPETETEANLQDIITEIKEAGAKIILLGVIGGFPKDYLAAMFARLSEENNLIYIPNILSGVIGHPTLMSDGIHPNQTGYQHIADKILPLLEDECANLKK